ncbi:MAG TPA: family 10 glycosylhydrolase, partial [Myxococcota bacterium]|nr:family 10 glycosylhydrolase [Myxococcota bacterium]
CSERTLESPEKITLLVERAAQLRASDLFVQVYRAGRSWFASSHADDAPFRAIRAAHPDAPAPLADLIARAHARGIRVHAWFNCLALAQNRDAPIVQQLGRDAVLVDRAGRSLLDYPEGNVPPPDGAWLELETPGYWLDPALPGVVEYLAATVEDLAREAPDLDGLHLDYIRYPYALPMTPGSRFRGLDFGYGESAKARFAAENGSFELGDKWDDFRRARVGELVARLRASMPSKWKLSAAVLAYADRAYLTALQDWRGWLEDGRLDFAVAMAYTRDDRLLRYQTRALRFGVGGERLWVGLGAWLVADDPARIAQQVALARAVQPAGVALFSYDALAAKPAALEALTHP